MSQSKLGPHFRGFTLAEVLITLGVIGVVVALTLPTLLSKVQEKVLENEAKKSAMIASNGYNLMSVHNDVFDVSNLRIFTCPDIECVSREHKEVFNITEDSVGGLRPTHFRGIMQ